MVYSRIVKTHQLHNYTHKAIKHSVFSPPFEIFFFRFSPATNAFNLANISEFLVYQIL